MSNIKELLLLAAQHTPCIDAHQFEQAAQIERRFEELLNDIIDQRVRKALQEINAKG